jgi:hypothetical protein
MKNYAWLGYYRDMGIGSTIKKTVYCLGILMQYYVIQNKYQKKRYFFSITTDDKIMYLYKVKVV